MATEENCSVVNSIQFKNVLLTRKFYNSMVKAAFELQKQEQGTCMMQFDRIQRYKYVSGVMSTLVMYIPHSNFCNSNASQKMNTII